MKMDDCSPPERVFVRASVRTISSRRNVCYVLVKLEARAEPEYIFRVNTASADMREFYLVRSLVRKRPIRASDYDDICFFFIILKPPAYLIAAGRELTRHKSRVRVWRDDLSKRNSRVSILYFNPQ